MSPRTRPRRSLAHHAEVTQQWLVFCLRQDWFALPIHVVQKVVQVEHLYGTGPDSTTGLVIYQDQEIPVIDLEQRIYRQCRRILSSSGELLFQSSGGRRFLAIATSPQGEPVGFLLNEPPTLRRLAESAFSSLPVTYLNEGSLKCVRAIAVPNSNEPPIFVLNLNQLFQPFDKANE
ncbi:chemotaxis protein CheW [Leptothermofonsia sp. ETS-13]|uniref:chemotaxis protein CheW n=1 Tax=Leptothermofonsia sp. ETS-13 TaxID=3035696 RepID=UPI003BA21DE3